MSSEMFDSYDVAEASRVLDRLHEQVIQRRQRVEISRNGDEPCVLISKAELDSLERALAILAGTEEAKAMSGKIAQLAALTTRADVATA